MKRFLVRALNVLIALLLLLLFFFTVQTWRLHHIDLHWFSDLSGRGAGTDRAFIDPPVSLLYSEAARPVSLVYAQNGQRWGAGFADPAVDGLYARIQYTLREALGSASQPTVIAQDAYRALLDNAVVIAYPAPLPLSLIHSWLSRAEQALPGGNAQTLAINFSDADGIVLCWEEGGRHYRADTQAWWRAEIDTALLQPLRFAFEIDTLTGLDDTHLVFGAAPSPHSWQIGRPGGWESWGLAVLRGIGENPDTAAAFPLGDARVFTAESYRMEINPNGSLRYDRLHLPEAATGQAEPAYLVERSLALLRCGEGHWGEASVMLTALEARDGGQVDIRFEYLPSGLRLFQENGELLTAGLFRFRNGILEHAELTLRHFGQGPAVTLSPEHVALWISGDLYPGSYLAVGQFIDGDWAKPSWYVAGVPQ